MNAVMGVAPAAVQANAAVTGVSHVAKPPPESRDDVVAAISSETTNGAAARNDVTVLKMTDSKVGQVVDVKA